MSAVRADAPTLTAARQLARRARQYGHFDTGPTLWVWCPVCRDKVVTDKVTGQSPYQLLDRTMVSHLRDGYCDGVRR